MDKLLRKIRRHHWKKRLKISKNAKFESDTSLASERRYSYKELPKFTDVCMVGADIVCYTAIFRVVTQRSSLRDDAKNDCVAD